MKKYLTSFIVIFISPLTGIGQEILELPENFRINANIDFYYAFDTDKGKKIREFSSESLIRDEFRLNLARISAAYYNDFFRGKLSLHYGDIPKYNWLTDNPNLGEANIGFSPLKNLWIDAGYFITHVGAESFPSDNFFSSFSLVSNYQPFYQSGIIFSYDFSSEISSSLFILNGYNLIEDNNKNKSFGVSFSYFPSDNISVTYNNIFGNEIPEGSPGKFHILNNLVLNFLPCERLETLLDIDFGMQEKSKVNFPDETAYAYGIMLSGRFKLLPVLSTSLRGEFYEDADGVYSGLITNDRGLKGNGITLGFEYNPVKNSYIRLEGRYIRLNNEAKIFYNGNNDRGEVIFSMGYRY